MPEYLAPGVYVEEVSFRAKSIEGVSTTTTGFVGPTRYGPVDLEPDVSRASSSSSAPTATGGCSSYAAEKDVSVALDPMDNYMWHAVRAFFEKGGKRLYVQRVFRGLLDEDDPAFDDSQADGRSNDGRAAAVLPSGGDPRTALRIKARFPGAAGGRRVRVTLRLGPNALTGATGTPRVTGLRDHDVVYILPEASPLASPLAGDFYRAVRRLDDTGAPQWSFTNATDTLQLATDLEPSTIGGDQVRDRDGHRHRDAERPRHALAGVVELPLDPEHELAGAPDSLFDRFAERPENLSLARTVPITITAGRARRRRRRRARRAVRRGALAPRPADPARRPEGPVHGRRALRRPPARRRQRRPPADGDGVRGRPRTRRAASKTGLKSLEDIEDISIVAAPGLHLRLRRRLPAPTRDDHPAADRPRRADALPDRGARLRRRPVHLRGARDARRSSTPSTPRSTTRGCGSWTRSRQREIDLPPSGFVAGIYARNDVQRAVYKAPANEVVTLAHRLRDAAQQGPAGGPQPRGHQLLPLLRGPRLPALGRAHDHVGPRVEVRQPAPLLRLPRALDRPRHAVGGVRAQRRGAVGQRAPHDRGLPVQRVADGRAARRQAGEGVLRQVRPLDDDPERPRQRPAGLPDRRRGAAPGRVRDLPHRPVDRGPRGC